MPQRSGVEWQTQTRRPAGRAIGAEDAGISVTEASAKVPALQAGPATDPTTLAIAWRALGFVHSRLGEPRQAIGCYRQALALVRDPKHALARRMRQVLLVRFGDACRAAGDLPAAVEAWLQAQQILRDRGWPESPRIRARLEQAGPPSPAG